MKIQIVVMAYNRYKHTCSVLSGLQENKARHVTVYLDAPKNSYDEEEQNKIKSALSTFDFEIELIQRPENLGLAKSISEAVTQTLYVNDAIILLEDDCVPKKGFLSYMTKLLNFYNGHAEVGAICGYTYPKPEGSDYKNTNDVFFINRFCPWGWATWSDKWDGFSLDLKASVQAANENKLNIRKLGSDIHSYCTNEHFLNNEMDIWSLNWILQLLNKNLKVAYPKHSLIENVGFDGSGVHSTVTNKFDTGLDVSPVDWGVLEVEKILSNEINTHVENQSHIVSFLEENSKMTYLLNNQNADHDLDKKLLKNIVNHYVDNNLKIIDFHTHLFPKSFNTYFLDGIENVLNYHYLHAEYLKLRIMSPSEFFKMPNHEKAKAIWTELFIKRLPFSEATKGVVTILSVLGISHSQKYEELVEEFDRVRLSEHDYVEAVFRHANVAKAVVTNDVFDQNEVDLYSELDERNFYTSIRLDSFFDNEPSEINFDGVSYNLKDELEEYIRLVVLKIKPLYFALSVDESFCVTDEKYIWMSKYIFGICKEFGIPVSLMIGVRRSVNSDYGLAGDGVVGYDLELLAQVISEHSDVHFCVTVLSREDQYALTVLSRKFQNLTIFGTWWFLNNDFFINEITRMRLNLLGVSFIPQHSDARVLEQVIYKWKHTNKQFKAILIDYFNFLIDNEFSLSKVEVENTIDYFYNGQIRKIIEENKCITC